MILKHRVSAIIIGETYRYKLSKMGTLTASLFQVILALTIALSKLLVIMVLTQIAGKKRSK